jgi:signal transduction histidine kinase
VSAAGLVPIALGTLTGRGETPAPDDEPRLMRRSILPGVMFVATAATLVTYTATSQPVGARLVLQGGLLAGSVLIFARQWLAVRTVDRIERERREALERRSRELEAYAYTASHDLKAPLVSIVGFTSAIERSAGGRLDDRSRLYLQRIHANAESLQRLIQDLFEFARAGVDERNAGPVDTAALVEELVAGHHGEARVRVASPLPVVRAHPVRLRQALTNLIDNAVRYGGGQIAISGRAEGAWAELVVEDNGPGVPEGERARLFDLFSRGADARTTAPEGTGLGLAVVKKIVEATGGSVRYEPADGARFVLTLPKGSV